MSGPRRPCSSSATPSFTPIGEAALSFAANFYVDGTLPKVGQDTGDWNQTETISLTGTSYEIRFIPGY